MGRKAASAEDMWTARTLLEVGAVLVAVLAVAFTALFGTSTPKLQLSIEQVDALMPEVGDETPGGYRSDSLGPSRDFPRDT